MHKSITHFREIYCPMAALKVFVSSTCYDLGIVRAELREFLHNLGHDPIMSEYNDVLFDPRDHTHESCINEVRNADAIVLIIGSRFGGKGVPTALDLVDFESLKSLSKSQEFLSEPNKVSITQLEILKAIEMNIPVYTFIDCKVIADHYLYERNKDKEFINEIDFPSIDRKDTAVYIFKFINYLRLRHHNNSIFEFSKISDIQNILRKQWSSQLQRLLQEDRNRTSNAKQNDRFLESLQEIKSLILSTINTESGKEIGKGVLNFRSLIRFCLSMNVPDVRDLVMSDLSWGDLMKKFGIIRVTMLSHRGRREEIFVKEDETIYINRGVSSEIYTSKWDQFKVLKKEVKESVFDSIAESEQHFLLPLRYRPVKFDDYIKEIRDDENGVGEEDGANGD